MKRTPPRLFLVDGMAIAYRSYFAFIQRPLMTTDGRNVSAIYGFTTFLQRIIADHAPDYLAVAFDTPEPTFRHTAYADYKATRERMPEDLASQIAPLKEVVHAYRIPMLEVPGFEADDIIGTLTRKAEDKGLRVVVVSGDKDLMQLITPKVSMLRPGKGGADPEVVEAGAVREKFGVTPDKVIEVLALTGDTSDNVPGVPGIGEKTAIPLIQKYGTLDKLYKHLDDIPQKGVRTKLTDHRDLAFLSRTLVTIHTDVPVSLDLDALRLEHPDVERLKELFASFEFRSLLARLGGAAATGAKPVEQIPVEAPEQQYATISTVPHTYKRVLTEADLTDLIAELRRAGRFVFDTETTSTDALRADLVGLSFAVREHEAWFVHILPSEGAALFSASTHEGITAEKAASLLRPILEDPSIPKAGHNIKYDILVLSRYGIDVRGVAFDTMVASYLLRADAQHGMDAVSREYLRYDPVSYTDLTGEGKNQRPLREVDPQALAEYASEDADVTLQLWDLFTARLAEQGMEDLAARMEMPLVPVLARMEKAGVGIDVRYLHSMSKDLERQIQNLVTEIHRLAGGPFNINSTQQLGQVLFTKLGLRTVRKTKTGFSTDVGVLEALRHEHPIVEQLLDYRQLAKLKSTYVDALPAIVHPDTGRVHTSFSQTVAATGRLSSSDPNLQNIPIRTEAGRAVRRAFIAAGTGTLLLSADYSQIELRIMAHIAGDEGLAQAFRNREDIHATTAAGVFNLPLSQVSKEMRRKAKEVNFGIMYGIGPFGLATRLEISQTEAKDIIDRYFERFPKVREYINDTIATATKKGYVETLKGRRRWLPDLRSQNRAVRQNAERQAINMPIQGTAADMIKLAMIRIDEDLRTKELRSAMILQVHDELVFEMRKEEEKDVRKIVERGMVDAMPLSVPVEVEMGSAPNWLDAH